MIALSASRDNEQHGDDVTGGLGAGAQASLGGALVIGAVIATVITLAVRTEPEVPADPLPRTVAAGTVTKPGLTSAIVQIR